MPGTRIEPLSWPSWSVDPEKMLVFLPECRQTTVMALKILPACLIGLVVCLSGCTKQTVLHKESSITFADGLAQTGDYQKMEEKFASSITKDGRPAEGKGGIAKPSFEWEKVGRPEFGEAGRSASGVLRQRSSDQSQFGTNLFNPGGPAREERSQSRFQRQDAGIGKVFGARTSS